MCPYYHLKYELKNVMVISHNVSAPGGGDAVPTETMSLSFQQVKQTYVEVDAIGEQEGHRRNDLQGHASSKKMRRSPVGWAKAHPTHVGTLPDRFRP